MKIDKLLANPKRILIVQTGNIGESVQTVPMLIALRTRFPFTDIAWLCQQETAKTLQSHWTVNRFIIVADDWYKTFTGIMNVRRQLHIFAPEVTLNVQGTYVSGWATWLSGAKRRICKTRNKPVSLPPSDNNGCGNTDIQDNLQLLQIFGVAGCSIGFDLPICEMDKRTATHKLHHIGLNGNYAVINVGAEYEPARWNEERFGLTAKYLLHQWNLPTLIVWNTRAEERLAEAAIRAAEGAAVPAPWFSPGELLAVLRWATVFISSDTPLLHLGAALGTRCIGLYGPTQGTLHAPFGKYNKAVQVRHWEEKTHSRKIKRDLIDAAETELVCGICDDVLNEILKPQTLPLWQKEPQKKAA
ncbi:MAG: glycosyltransferase family 9 protein [Planctomycetaceae bacterium]|jgi:ADP-heptose:LPS heptosyltransferase|nr:glycosyltransferase family 9 protein [Planctomycetaceae bacterium]